jgi:ATP-dependent RNA helicase RhlB
MFDKGFIRDIRYILKSVPDDSRTMVFSATLSFNVLKVAGEFMKDPVEVEIQSESIAVDRIAQNLLHLSRSEKMPYLVNSLLAMENPRAIVFTNTKYTVQKIVDHCHRYGIAATGISSLLDQKKRIRLLKDFKEGKYTVLVATDVASRGLDIDDIAHVFNFDLPQDAESYVHRIGRTARAGKDGISVSFCSEDDYDFLPRIQRYLDTKIPVAEINSAFVAYPSGNFSAYVDEHQPKHEKPKAGAAAGTGGTRRNNRNRNTRRPKDGAEKRVPSHADEAAPVHTERKQTHGGSDAASIRESDRAAILSGVNTKAGGGGVLTEDKNYRPAEQKSNRRRKNKNRNNTRKPGPEEETGRPSKNNYRDRDSDHKGSSDRRSSDSRGEPRSQHSRGEPRDTRGQKRTTSKSGRITTISRTPAKQGIISKILGFFGK